MAFLFSKLVFGTTVPDNDGTQNIYADVPFASVSLLLLLVEDFKCCLKRLAVAVRKSYEVTIPTSWLSSTTGRQPILDSRMISIASRVDVTDETLSLIHI